MSKSTEEILKQTQPARQSLLSDENSGSPMPNLARFFKEVGEELGHLGAQGAHELAASLYTGSGFVMYPHAGQESVDQAPMQGLPFEAQKVEPMQQQPIESDGMSM